MSRPIVPPIHRFLAMVKVTSGCWHWRGAVQTRGYGSFGITRRQTILAHRFAYEALVGPIPEGLTIDHTCLNKLCVNPDHLEPVTLAENARRAGVVMRSTAAYPCGHPRTGANTVTQKRPKDRNTPRRTCRTCRNERARQLYAEKKSA